MRTVSALSYGLRRKCTDLSELLQKYSTKKRHRNYSVVSLLSYFSLVMSMSADCSFFITAAVHLPGYPEADLPDRPDGSGATVPDTAESMPPCCFRSCPPAFLH